MKTNTMSETHPYPPVFDNNTKILIIGTAPPMRFTQKLKLNPDDVNFFYGSRDNYFWDLIGDTFGIKFLRQNSDVAIKQREEFLKMHNIGLADIVLEFSRNDNDASDNNLNVKNFQNIYEILLQNPLIKKVYFTGYSGPNSAEGLTSRHLGEHKVFNSLISKEPPKHKSFMINKHVIESYSLFSPSPRVMVTKKYEDLLSQYKILRNDM